MTDRNTYIDDAKAQLERLREELERLEAEAEKKSAELEIKRREQLKAIRRKYEVAETQAEGLRGATEDAWEDLKAGYEVARDEIAEAVKDARDRYSSVRKSNAR